MEIERMMDVRDIKFAEPYNAMLEWLKTEIGPLHDEEYEEDEGEGPEFSYYHVGTGWKYVFHRTGIEPSKSMLPFCTVRKDTMYNKRRPGSVIADSFPIETMYVANYVIFDEITDAIKAKLTHFGI